MGSCLVALNLFEVGTSLLGLFEMFVDREVANAGVLSLSYHLGLCSKQ